ncbi:MAG: N-acetyltransferase, partial [bacterium]|nr:N-acetyltransferase [bacterium]
MEAKKARITDVPQIHKLVNSFGSQGLMLARPLSEIYENLRDFFVVREGEELLGCGALHICWEDLVEVKSVAVLEGNQGKGIGAVIVEACIEEARSLDVAELFVLTYEPDFFTRFGFNQVDLMELPRKVWGECQRCPKYPDCDENA